MTLEEILTNRNRLSEDILGEVTDVFGFDGGRAAGLAEASAHDRTQE